MKRHITYRSGSGRLSFHVRRKTVVTIAVLTVLLVAVFVISTGLGNKFTPPMDVVRTILGRGTPQDALIVGTLRLPRILLAVLVGAALAVSGSILQGVIRNPLASPDVIGITGEPLLRLFSSSPTEEARSASDGFRRPHSSGPASFRSSSTGWPGTKE